MSTEQLSLIHPQSSPPSPLVEAPEASAGKPEILSVSAVNKLVKHELEEEFSRIWVKGEISNFKPHSSGHFYFSLKDDKAQISAVMFRGFNTLLRFKPTDGTEVIVRGRLTVYEPRGNYQIFCESMEPVGHGALQLAFEQLKQKLKSEGLFETHRKRPLPRFPRRIALVTSPTGAAVRDILNVIKRRYRNVEVFVIPTSVQGAQAPREIVAAIQLANKLGNFDVMIVGRGGGSIEDLWSFNEEIVARAIANSKIPTVSAVGHEIDFTIADFVADLRAPTPSAAAELVVPSTDDLVGAVISFHRQLQTLITKKIMFHRQRHVGLSQRLVDPKRRLQDIAMRCDELSERLTSAVFRNLLERRQSLEISRRRLGDPEQLVLVKQKELSFLDLQLKNAQKQWMEQIKNRFIQVGVRLHSISPLKVLDRGYSIVTRGEAAIKNVQQIHIGQRVRIRFAQGCAEAEITQTTDTDITSEGKYGF